MVHNLAPCLRFIAASATTHLLIVPRRHSSLRAGGHFAQMLGVTRLLEHRRALPKSNVPAREVLCLSIPQTRLFAPIPLLLPST
jgi:hypothetical protein